MKKGPYARDLLIQLKENGKLRDFYDYGEIFHIITEPVERPGDVGSLWISKRVLKQLLTSPEDMPRIMSLEDNDRSTYKETAFLKIFCKEYLESNFTL